MTPPRRRPTAGALAAAQDVVLPDLVRDGLRVLFVGINPGLWSGATGRHFGNPANRLWPVLHQAGFTPRRFGPDDAEELLALGYGISNLVARTTATAAELSREELRAGVPRLASTVERHRPGMLAFLGLSAYRTAYGRPHAGVGRQAETVAGVGLWLLPNTSGLNAHHQLPDLVRLFAALRAAVPR